VFRSLDFLYTPAADVDAEIDYLVDVVEATLEWRISSMGTTVASLRVDELGPRVLLAGHLAGTAPVAIHRVDDYAAAVAALRAQGAELRQLEIPPGPCAVFVTPSGQRLGVYELVRPEVVEEFARRFKR
jgi:hypothetical protein